MTTNKIDLNMATEAEKKKIEENWKKERQRNLPIFLVQVTFAVAFNACVLGGGYYLFPAIIPLPSSNDFTVKLLYTLRCFVFPQTIVFIFAIMRVMRKRGNTPAGNPLLGQDQNYLLAEKNALTNTVEQLLCILLLILVLITYLEPSEMKIIPLLSISFAVGRLLHPWLQHRSSISCCRDYYKLLLYYAHDYLHHLFDVQLWPYVQHSIHPWPLRWWSFWED